VKKYINYFWGLAFTPTAKSTYITTFGAGLNALFGFIFTVIVARSISPAEFGFFSVAMNFVMILLVMCDIGLSSSILRFLPRVIRDNKKDEVQKIIKLSFIITIVIGGILTTLLFLFAPPIAHLIFTKGELVLPLTIVGFSLIGLTLSLVFTSILQGQQRFVFGVITDSSIVLLKTLATIILLVLGKLTLTSVLIVFSTTAFSGFLIGFLFVGPKFLLAKTDLSLARTLIFFGFWVALARIANSIAGRLDTIMLIRYVDAAQVGFYAAAQRITFIFPVLVNGMTVVLTPKFSSLQTKKQAISFFKKANLLIGLLFIPLVVLFILAPWITILVYGEVYRSSIYILRWLLASSFFFVASSVPIIALLYFLGKSQIFAILSFAQLLLIFLGNLILIPRFGVIGPAISLAVAYGITFLVGLLIFVKKTREK
jgi:O-antigen/teichoic acid export membrane protein